MTDVFMTVLRMSVTGSFVILAVLLVRLALKKVPKRWSWALWSIVLFRLLTPFGIPVSVPLPDLSVLSSGAESAWDGAEVSTVSDFSESAVPSPGPSVGAGGSASEVYAPDPAAALPEAHGDGAIEGGNALPASLEPVEEHDRADLRDRVLTAVPFVWLAGAAAMIVWNLVSCALLKRKLREAVPIGGNLYETDRVDAAFVFGLFSPRVYLPAGLGQVEKACVAEHERVHVRRLDPLWRLLSFAALSLHWFNPLVWLAFRLSGKDMEMSCDEAVLKRASVDIRAAYSRTLVKFASRGRIEGPALAFGEGETGSRVKNVMKYKKPVLWVSVAAGIVLVLSAVVLAVNLTAKDTSLPYARYSIDEVVYFNDVRSEEILSRMLIEIAGDGSVWVRFDRSDADWESSSSIEPLSTDGLADFVREQTGVKIAGITDAYRHRNPESTSEWLFFATASGDVYFASVGTELGVMQSVGWLCRLRNEFPASTFRERVSVMHPDFMARSLTKGVGREINCFYSYTEDVDSEIVYEVFTAGASLNPFERDYVVYTPGVAVFQRTHRNAGMKLLGWGLAKDWPVESESWEPSILFCEHGALSVLSFSLEDGRTLSANITLPERKISLFGREAFEGACSVRFYEGEDPLFWSSALPHTVYTVKEMVYSVYESGEQAQTQSDGFTEGLRMLRLMLAGDGTLFTRTPGTDEWQANLLLPGVGTQAWIRDGALISDCIRGIDSPEAFADMIYETTGIKVGRVTEAVVDINEPYSPNHSVYDALFSTEDGKIRLVTVGGRKTLERGNAMWMLEMIPETVGAEETDSFFSNSLLLPLKTLLPAEEQPEVFVYDELRDREDRRILLFMAGEQVNTRIGQPDNETPFHFGIAVFLPEKNGKGLRLANCAVCPDVTVTYQFRDAAPNEPQEPRTVRRDGDDFVFLTEDGQSIRARLTLPERKKTLRGRAEYVGECSIRFPGNAEDAYEVPAFLDALPYTRYSVEEMLYHIRDLTPEQSEFLSSRRFEIAGNCSLWRTDWEDIWSYIGKGTLNPSMGGRSVEEWILDQTGVEVGLVKEARLFSGQMNHGTILFSTRDGGFYAASVYPGNEPDPPECSSLFRLRCETEPGNRLWIDEDFAERTLESALERDVHVPALHTAYPPGIAVVPFVAGLTWKEINTMASYDSAKISCQIGAAVFELGSRSARLLKWAVCEDVSFTGWYPEREMITCEIPSDDTILFTLPDGSSVRADLSLPERKSLFFGLIEQKQLVGECSIRFTVEKEGAVPSQPEEAPKLTEEELEELYERQEAERQKALEQQREESLLQTREQIDAAYDAFLAEHYELEDMSSYLAAYATRRIDLNGDGWNELVVYRMPTESSYPLDIYEYSHQYDTVRAFHTSLEGIPASLNADPSGFWCAQIGAHDPDLPDGFYGDFFTFGDQTYLISMDASEWWKKLECHAFTTVSGSLAANTVFSAERCGPFYFDEAKRNRSFVNGQEIPFDGYFDALTDWRETWKERTGGDGEVFYQTPLWNESEVSGWPIVWYPPPDAETGIEQWWSDRNGQPLFRLIYPAGWEDNVIVLTGGAWAEDPDNPVPLRIDFYDKPEREKNGIGLLGSLVLYRHAVDRFYPTRHEELMTLTTPDGESYDLVLVFPGDMQYWDYRDHYTFWQIRLRSVASRVKPAEGIPETIAPERAMHLLHDALVRAYENIWGPFEPLYADPTPEGAVSVEDSLWLRWVTTRLVMADGRQVGAWEDEDYYWFPIIFPFAVDKRTGEIYKVYNGLETVFYSFDPEDPNALGFAG